MGLCKCPKRRVTNQFCFEHRVNVCEYCIVTNHSKCVVQSYLRWLQDSDYSPTCVLCSKDLVIEDCVRLTCYHLFHWACLDQFARTLPATTAPAGYTCPMCKVCVFPPSNLVSQVADVLREKLAGVNWARVGLGLPLLSEEVEPTVANHVDSYHQSNSSYQANRNSQDAVLLIEEPTTTYSRTEMSGQQSRRGYKTVDEIEPVVFDHDENKYKRRSFFEWFKRRLNSAGRCSRYCHPRSTFICFCKIIILFVLGVILCILLFKIGRYMNFNDPFFDPMNNQHIRINDD